MDFHSLLPSSSLREIYILGCRLDQSFATALPKCRRLEYVGGDASLDDSHLRAVSQIATIRQVAFAFCSVTDSGLQSLAKCKRLDSVFVPGTYVTREGANKLLQTSRVKHIIWSTVGRKGRQLASLQRLYRNQFTLVTQNQAFLVKDGKSRYVSGTSPDTRYVVGADEESVTYEEFPDDLQVLGEEPLRLDLSSRNTAIIKAIQNVDGIHTLELKEGLQFSSKEYSQLAALAVKRIEIKGGTWENDAIVELLKGQDLESLTLTRCKLGLDSFHAMSTSKKVTTLTLQSCAIEKDSVLLADMLPMLKRLDLVKCEGIPPRGQFGAED